MTLQEFLASKGFGSLFQGNYNGEFERTGRGGRQLNAWFVGREHRIGDRVIQVARFGDWATDEKHTWSSTRAEDMPQQELEELVKAIQQAEEEERAKRAEDQLTVALEATKQWEYSMDRGTSPYLTKKGLGQSLFGCRLSLVNGDLNTLVSARDVLGNLWGYQRIKPDGGKYFLPGMRIKGNFHLIGDLSEQTERIYLAEGIATAASIFVALGESTPVASAFNAGNLERVASALRKRYPQLQIVVAGDWDFWTRRPDGTAWNPGREAALAAAKACSGVALFPRFASLANEERPTDFNDLAQREGTDRVGEILGGLWETLRERAAAQALEPASFDAEAKPLGQESPVAQTQGPGAGVLSLLAPRSVEPLPVKTKKDKATGETAVVARKEQEYADALLTHYGFALIKQASDLFIYTGTHWKNLDEGELDYIKLQIQRLASGCLTAGKVEAVFKLFVTGVPKVPSGVDLFIPPPMAANFQNGTLFVTKDKATRAYTTYFRGHKREDWLVNVLPYEYRAGDESRNLEFEAMLDRVFAGDPDIEEKKRAVAQMYGACLLPAFPHLFMLYGPPGTGKSTVILIASRLVHKDNQCSVDPTDFEGFNMETMPGKLVNIDTDIEMHKPISEKIVKKIIDRVPLRIRRKRIKDISAPIPSTHIFGGNGIPKTLDGASRAQDRRWTFIGFEKLVAKGQYDVEYHDFCFEQGPQGILNFALRGLEDLLKGRGHFCNPASGKAKMEEWQLTTDPVGQFLQECREGLVQDQNTKVMVGPTWRIKRSQLWALFKEFHLDSYGRPQQVQKRAFFNVVRERGFGETLWNGYDHFTGIGVVEVENAHF